ncbi:hypothetical protein C0583_02170 [Candidatus Parcubacteria bacterium]|nr:MAG: hypothetical protein C0583_02170 [Candidatus Parcubacteria bacterium]
MDRVIKNNALLFIGVFTLLNISLLTMIYLTKINFSIETILIFCLFISIPGLAIIKKVNFKNFIFFSLLFFGLILSLFFLPKQINKNFINAFVLLFFMFYCPGLPLRIMIIVCVAVSFFDFINVYFLDTMTTYTNQLAKMNSPGLIEIPAQKSIDIIQKVLTTNSEKTQTILTNNNFDFYLGTGDLLFPLLLTKSYIVNTLHYSKIKSLVVLLLTFICGISISLTFLFIFNTSQPAMLFLVPCMLLGIYFLDKKNKTID